MVGHAREVGPRDHGDRLAGISRFPYASGTALNKIVRATIAAVQMPGETPHSFRKTLARYGGEICTSMAQLKEWSLNLGHENLATTVDAYIPVSRERQAEILRRLAGK